MADFLGLNFPFSATYPIQVERSEIVIPGLPAAFDGFTIVQLSDIHYSDLLGRERLRSIVDVANGLNPDLVALTGDYVATDKVKHFRPAVEILSELKAAFGVYAVLGNHDHWADADVARQQFRESSIDLLECRTVPIEIGDDRIWLAGTGDLWEGDTDIDPVLRDISLDEPRIVLTHNPDFADELWFSRIDLILAGHTHGGQVVLPWLGAPFIPVRNRQYQEGLVQTERTQVSISRGLGTGMPPVRWNSPPHMPVVTLRRGEDYATAIAAAEKQPSVKQRKLAA